MTLEQMKKINQHNLEIAYATLREQVEALGLIVCGEDLSRSRASWKDGDVSKQVTQIAGLLNQQDMLMSMEEEPFVLTEYFPNLKKRESYPETMR